MLALEVAAQAGARGEAELTDQAAVGLLTSVDDLGGREGEHSIRAEGLACHPCIPRRTRPKLPAVSTKAHLLQPSHLSSLIWVMLAFFRSFHSSGPLHMLFLKVEDSSSWCSGLTLIFKKPT